MRVDRINARVKAIEKFKREIADGQRWMKESGEKFELIFPYRHIENPQWFKHNEQVLDRTYELLQNINGQINILKRILSVITFLSIIVVLYSICTLFLIGLEMEIVKSLDPMTASTAVLMQLLPLPLASAIFFFVARRMSKDVDRKIRSVGDLNLMLSSPDVGKINAYVSVEQVYQRHTGAFNIT
ncbi:MAG: hypothetical protein KC484_13080, partial [Colwelliaceae bacterium]|nr:hypothetical protein [Colwelliaceae bacterium]